MENNWRAEYEQKKVTPREAVKCTKSGDSVYVGTCTSVAYTLCDALGERADDLEAVTITCSQILNPVKCFENKNPGAFKVNSYFLGPQERNFRKKGGELDFTSFHLSQVDIWCKKIAPADVAFLEVSMPDDNGYVSFGASGVAVNTYVKDVAKTIVLEINKNAPYVLGEKNRMHISEADMLIESEVPIFEKKSMPVSGEIETISDYILEQIHDGACIQLGIGGVADAVGYGLKNKNDLGVHSELFTDSMMELTKMGVINNSRKNYFKGKSVTSFALGTKELYEYISYNEDVYFMPFPDVNSVANIAKNDNMISINTAMSIDLFGQVCADNIAGNQYSATGGQVDFVRGAQMSNGGKSFITLTSTFQSKGERKSRIVPRLPYGAAVTTPRSDVQYLVTEFGCVNLKELTMKERTSAIISLAHPDMREELRLEAKKLGMV